MLTCGSASLGMSGSTQRLSPPVAAFLVLFLLVVRRQEWDGSQILLFRADAPQQDEPVDLAVDARAPALLYGDFDVPVVLDRKTVSCRLLSRTRSFDAGSGEQDASDVECAQRQSSWTSVLGMSSQ